ncbi:MFS transporter [Mycobacterium sp. GA-2829]|uniref:MFS transporter n=1 Tax=Mycobacterium sp. GA-2829 TaxID=1772283 RepID=UPI00074032C8|nr:MFS transporter [Mycobacterium sp. GA-2829]KUI36466.1 MFS transporter [Mycobacterium sp. GA-2829]
MTTKPHVAARGGTSALSTLIVVVASVFAYKGLESVLSPVVPIIQESLDATEAQIAWVLTAVLLTGAVTTPLIGKLADIRDKKTVLLWVLAIIALGVVISGLSVNVLMLTVGQLLQGIGLGVVPLAFAIIRDTQTEERAKSGNGAVIAFIYAATAFAMVGSGILVSWLPWRWVFCIPLVLIAIIFVASWKVLPSCPPVHHGKVDWTGAVVLGASLSVILVAITEAPTLGWTSMKFGAAVLLGLALLGVFCVVELRTREPLVDLRVLATRPLAVACLVYVLGGFGVNMMFLAMPMLAQQPASTGYGLGATAFTTSLILLPIGLAGAVAAPVTSWLDARIGSRATLIAAVLTNGSSFVVLWFAGGSVAVVVIASILIGASGGVCLTQAMNVVTLLAPADQVGAFSGLAFVVKAVGGTLGVQLCGSLLSTGSDGGSPAWSSFTNVFIVGIGLTVLVAASCLLLPRTLGAKAAPVDNKERVAAE